MTDLSGIIVARSAFENSLRYRSAVLYGTFTRVPGADVPRALDLFTERLIPGRTAEIRPMHRRELAATMVLAMPIRDWSLKISGARPTDPPDDVAGGAWAGVVPFDARRLGDPRPAPDLRAGIPVPASVRAMTRRGQPDPAHHGHHVHIMQFPGSSRRSLRRIASAAARLRWSR